MTKKLILLVSIFLLLFCSKSKKEINDITARLDEFLTGQAKYFHFNGNVLVAEKGEILFQKSFGCSDFETSRLLNDSSVFELASIGKQFTATAILLLKDQGKLKLTDSLRHYFPELPYSGVTIYQMLTHTSGLPVYEYLMDQKWDRGKILTNSELIDFFARERPQVLFPPGARWEYNNTAYALLASIIEKVSGISFSYFMAENIFQPLQMNNTGIYNHLSIKAHHANYAFGFGYNVATGNYYKLEDVVDYSFAANFDGIQGHVAVNSTTTDLLKWDRSVKNHTLLNEATQEEMLEQHVVIDTLYKTFYGYGVYLSQTEMGYFVYHAGGWMGYKTFLARNVDRDQTFIVLSNNGSNSLQLSMAMHEIINGKPIIMPYEHKEVPMDSTTLQHFTGRYIAIREISIQCTGNKLFRIATGKPKVELKPESATKFFYADGSDRQIEFKLDSDNKVVQALLISNGRTTEYRLID